MELLVVFSLIGSLGLILAVAEGSRVAYISYKETKAVGDAKKTDI